MDGTEFPETYSPDGLTGAVLDELVDQVDAAIAGAPRPTSALLDGSGAERRRRRIERRSVAAVVRELPLRRGADSGPGGREVA